MAEEIFASSDSVRSAKPLAFAQKWQLPGIFRLQSGEELPEVTVVYETYGSLNAEKNNAIVILHALSGDSHVASHNADDDPGWWELMVGPGKSIDTDRYFVICANVLGGCRGTTGPDSLDPRTGKPYGMDFPSIAISDIVEVQRRLVEEHLGIKKLFAVIGGSLGGLMVLDWATRFPDKMFASVAIATSARVSTQSLAFDIVARNAIMNDPHFYGGQYYDKEQGPATGLAIARMLGHITYLSREAMNKKFESNRNAGRKIDSTFETKFSVGSYLAYQGDKFVERFDANSYLALSMALDTFDLGETPEKLIQNLEKSLCRWLFVSFTSDWLFPPAQSKELVDAALASNRRVSYCNVESDSGHDAFLLEKEIQFYGKMLRSFLKNAEKEAFLSGDSQSQSGVFQASAGEFAPEKRKHRIDYDQILELIPPDKSVLDLGCGKGDLLVHLRDKGNKTLFGLELEEERILQCVEKDLNVIQADMDKGLLSFRENQFDYVVLSKTLQTVRNVEIVVEEMLRVGKEVIVSFPNFGYHRFRTEFEMFGYAPQTDQRPGRKWFNTSDVRFLTIADFEEFCQEKGYKILQMVALDTEREKTITEGANVLADVVIMVLMKDGKKPFQSLLKT